MKDESNLNFLKELVSRVVICITLYFVTITAVELQIVTITAIE